MHTIATFRTAAILSALLALLAWAPAPAAAADRADGLGAAIGKQLGEWRFDTDRLRENAERLVEEGGDTLKDRADRLEDAVGQAREFLGGLRGAGGEQWQRIRERVQQAWEDLKAEVEAARRQRERESAPPARRWRV